LLIQRNIDTTSTHLYVFVCSR